MDESSFEGWNAFPAQADGPGGGETFGSYRLDAMLGEGAVGRVFRATDTRSGDVVALKIMRRTLADDDDDDDDVYRKRLEREARVAAEVESRHLVPVLASGVESGDQYLVVRYVEGETLADRLEREDAMPVEKIVRLVTEIGRARRAPRARDRAPGRQALQRHARRDRNGSLDGFRPREGSSLHRPDEDGAGGGKARLHRPRDHLGRGGATGERYLRARLCHLRVRDRRGTVRARSLFEVAVAHLEDQPTDPCTLRPELPLELGWAILRALTKKPDERPPTAVTYANLVGAAAT